MFSIEVAAVVWVIVGPVLGYFAGMAVGRIVREPARPRSDPQDAIVLPAPKHVPAPPDRPFAMPPRRSMVLPGPAGPIAMQMDDEQPGEATR